MAGLFYLPLLQGFGLNPIPYHAVMLAILLGNLYLMYRFARRIGCGELQAGLATLIVAYHAGLSMLYYNTAFIYDVLCFSFYMGAFLCYARVRAQGRLLRGSETALVMGLYLCALDSKEMALTLPIVLLAYEWIYHPGDGRPAAWTPREIARWLRGPGRVMLYCAALNLVYLYGKAFGPDALMQSPAYRPELSLHRVFAFEKTAMGDLFLAWGSFSWRGVVAVWVLLAWLAWRRPRPVLRFCWVFLMLTPLPLAVLEGRGAACLYIPLAGWAVFAAVVLTDVAGAAARFLAEEPLFRRAGYAGLFAAILCTSFFFWAKQNDYLKRDVRPGCHGGSRQTDRGCDPATAGAEPTREIGHPCGISERPLRRLGHVLHRRTVVPRQEPAVSSATQDAAAAGRTGEDDGFRLSEWAAGAGNRAAAAHRWRITASVNSDVEELPPTSPVR